MKRKHYMVSDKTIKQLQDIEKINGAAASATIRIAVAEYHKKIIKGEQDGVDNL